MKNSMATLAVLISSLTSSYAQLPEDGFAMDPSTPIVFTDHQEDFLNPDVVSFRVVGNSVVAYITASESEALSKVTKERNSTVFDPSQHNFNLDHTWKFEGASEGLTNNLNVFDRTEALSMVSYEGFAGGWLEKYKGYTNRSRAIVTSPHKIIGAESNNLSLQLPKHDFKKVILGEMSANLITESRLRLIVRRRF